MNLLKTIADLKQERVQIEVAIGTLERLASVNGQKRRGRPPAWLSAMNHNSNAETTAVTTQKSGRTFSKAQKKAASERMKKRWALKRKEEKATAKAKAAEA